MNSISGFQALTGRSIITGFIETRTAMHIGSSRSLSATGTDLPVLTDHLGRPIIPGSSFKGTLRSQVEALLRAVNKVPELWSCDLISTKGCVSQYSRSAGNEAQILAGACTACTIFGGTSLGSKLSVADMCIADSAAWDPYLMQVRDSVAINRDTQTAAGKAKFDYEVVPPGVRFRLELMLDNATDKEVGIVLRGLQLFHEGYAFLGGKSSRGAGRVEIHDLSVRTIDSVSFLLGTRPAVAKIDDASHDRYYAAIAREIEVPGNA